MNYICPQGTNLVSTFCKTSPLCDVGVSYNSTSRKCSSLPACTNFNSTTGKCPENPICPAGSSFNSTTGKCSVNVTCTNFNASSGKCPENPICPTGSSFNSTTGKCSAVSPCPTGFTYNSTAKECQKAPTCPTGLVLYNGECTVGAAAQPPNGLSCPSATPHFNPTNNKCYQTVSTNASNGSLNFAGTSVSISPPPNVPPSGSCNNNTCNTSLDNITRTDNISRFADIRDVTGCNACPSNMNMNTRLYPTTNYNTCKYNTCNAKMKQYYDMVSTGQIREQPDHDSSGYTECRGCPVAEYQLFGEGNIIPAGYNPASRADTGVVAAQPSQPNQPAAPPPPPINTNAVRISPQGRAAADPSVVYRNGYFYGLFTSDGIQIYQKQTNSVTNGLFDGARVITLKFTNEIQVDLGLSQISSTWAPELVFIQEVNTWYIFFSCSDVYGTDSGSQIYYMFNNSGNPDLTMRENWQGVFRITNYSGWGIDPTIALINGNRYLIYSFKNDYWRDPQSLRIQRIIFDNATKRTSLTGSPQIISTPDNNWETVDLRVNEGPEFIQDPATGKMHIVYSASFSQSPEYCLGMLTLNGNDPMVRSNWSKSNGPVFKYQNGSGMYGTGHNCFTDVNGVWYNFFHATQTQGSQWGNRVSLAQPFTFSNTGVPQLGTPTRDPGASLAL